MPKEPAANAGDFKNQTPPAKSGSVINWVIGSRNQIHHILERILELDVPGLALSVSAGMPIEFAAALFAELAMSRREANDMLGLKDSTFSRKSSAGTPLAPEEAERVLDLARLLAIAQSHSARTADGRRQACRQLKVWLSGAHPRMNMTPPGAHMAFGFGRAQAVSLLQHDFAQSRLQVT
jgi:uncharacterized protein (DUF2384 family)